MHSGPFVEMKCAGVALGVDAEADAPLAARPELAERLRQQRCSEPPPPPGTPCEQDGDPPAAVQACDVDRSGSDLAAGTYHRPQRRIELGAVDVKGPPLVERARPVLPVVGERLLLRGVERTR